MKFICNNIERQKERGRVRQRKHPKRQQNSKTINKDNEEEPEQCTVRNKYAKKDSNAKAATEAGNSRGWRALQSALISSKWPVK